VAASKAQRRRPYRLQLLVSTVSFDIEQMERYR